MQHLHSILDIAGTSETGIARSFGAILRKDKTLLNKLIELTDPRAQRLTNTDFDKTDFLFEKSSAEGRTDIEIQNEELHLIIESKIGTSSVKFKQADLYCRDRLKNSTSKFKCFVFLTEIGNIDVPNQLRKKYPKVRFATLSWDQTLGIIASRRNIVVNLVEEYQKYILGAQKMRIFDIDIWAVVVSQKKQRTNFDRHNFYINDKRHSPIFIAKREWDPTRKKVIIRDLRPVVKIHDRQSEKGKKNSHCYVYDLGSVLKLEKPILRKFSQAGAIAVAFTHL
jgi:hypothetical protein